MALAEDTEIIEQFEEFYRDYYRNEIGELARKYPNDQRSLYISWNDLYRYDQTLAEQYRNRPTQLTEYAEEALRLYDLPVDVSLGQAHVRVRDFPHATEIRAIRAHHRGQLICVQGIVRKATDVRPKVQLAAFECQRCGTLTRIPQSGGDFQEPHECQGCERQGPYRINYDESEFVDAQKIRVQESPEGLRGGETPQNIDVHIEDDLPGKVTAGDHVKVVGVLHLDQQETQNQKSAMFDVFLEGLSVEIEDEQFEEMDITDEDKQQIVALSDEPDIYDQMVASMAPSIYGYEDEKLAIILQMFSGVTKHLPDGSRIRGDFHILLIGDPGTGKSQLLQYVRSISPRAVYTSGKGSSSAGLTAAAVRDDFGDGQQWTLEAGALVLADQGIAAIDELDKMRCVTGDTLVQLGDGRIARIRELAHEASIDGNIEELPNGRTIRGVDFDAWTMTADGRLVQRPVTAVHEYDAPDRLIEVTLQSGETVTATADHPFLVFEGAERVEKAAADLIDDDWVYVPKQLPQTVTDGGAAALDTDSTVVRESDGVSPAFAAVLGYLSGDGNVYYDREEGVYGIRFTNKEAQLLDDFEAVCQETFGVEPVRPPSEQRADGVETIRLPGKAYADAVLDAGMNVETYDRKAFPEGVGATSREAKAAFVRALADSEGTVDERAVKIYSASYELLIGTKQLLLEFKVSSQIQTRDREGKRDLYVLAITDAASLDAFNRHIGFALDRKQTALNAACERVSGDRTILDVLPKCGELLGDLRASLRLYQSECGIADATYCNFENGDANVSFRCAGTILDTFERRQKEATQDAERLSDSVEWPTLERLTQRYHVSQRELAEGTRYSQPYISEHWAACEELAEMVRERLRTIVGAVAETNLTPLRTLVSGDVKWRRVKSVEQTTPEPIDDRIELLRGEIADLLCCTTAEAVGAARQELDREPDTSSWSALRSELDRHEISFTDLARDLGVAQSTVSRWFNGTVETDQFVAVESAARSRIERTRDTLDELLTEIEARRSPKVYDLTVEGTHNFVANSMIVHNSEDRSAMHEALEQQSISISKAGINATLKSRCALLGAANPKYGRFDEYEAIADQINLEPALVSRFDLIFTITDKPDPEKDRLLAEHILDTNYAGELHTHRQENATSDYTQEEVDSVTQTVEPAIDAEFLRKYIAYAKRNCFPVMTEEARDEIEEFYVDLRAQGTDGESPVPVTARKLEGLVRLSEASARVRLSDRVEAVDARRVIEVVRTSMEDIGMDPETGEFDADIIETGTSKTQRDRIRNIKAIIREIEEEYDEGAPIEEVLERAEAAGMEQSKAEHEIEKLRRQGDVYEPSQDHLRTV